MPILNIHLVAGQHTTEQVGELLQACSALFAEVLKAPVERIRVFATEYAPTHACLGGQLVSAGAPPAPYFSFIVLEDRSVEDRQRLLTGFTDRIVDILGVDRSRVRGGIVPVAASDWSIAGQPANILRAAEIAARQASTANSGEQS